MWYLIGGILCGVGLLTVGGVTIVAVPRIVRLRPRPQRRVDREAAVKERILVERLTRRFHVLSTAAQRRVRKRFTSWTDRLQRGYRRLRLLAQEHLPAGVEEDPQSCEVFLAQAQTAMEMESYDDAEERFLACLKIDAKRREAYLGLSELYRKRKELSLAEETLRFLRRLYPDDDEVAFDLAEVLYERGDTAAAVRVMDGIARNASKNPRYLDFAVELAIVNQDATRARRFLEQLREANPENQKLEELGERIAAL